jgi:hypothetical protein
LEGSGNDAPTCAGFTPEHTLESSEEALADPLVERPISEGRLDRVEPGWVTAPASV